MRTIRLLAAAAAVSMSLPVFAGTSTFDFTTVAPSSSTAFNPYTGTYSSGVANANYISSQNISTEYGNTLTFGSSASTSGGSGSATVSVSAYASTGLTSGTATAGAAGGKAVTYGTDTSQQINSAITTYYSGNGLAITSANTTAATPASYNTNAYGKNVEFYCQGDGKANYSSGQGTGTGCADNSGSFGSTPGNPNTNVSAGNDYEHAIDNEGAYEALLLSFSTKVTLSSLTFGFTASGSGGQGAGADSTVLYYTGSGTPTAALTSNSFASLLSNGWAVANGSQYNNDTAGTTVNVSQTAQYFMIGAYIPLGQSPGADDSNPDYMKLKSIVTSTAPAGGTVPEPGSIALFGIAGGALFVGRRRRQAKAA